MTAARTLKTADPPDSFIPLLGGSGKSVERPRPLPDRSGMPFLTGGLQAATSQRSKCIFLEFAYLIFKEPPKTASSVTHRSRTLSVVSCPDHVCAKLSWWPKKDFWTETFHTDWPHLKDEHLLMQAPIQTRRHKIAAKINDTFTAEDPLLFLNHVR